MNLLEITSFTGSPTILHDLLNSEITGFNKVGDRENDGRSSFMGVGDAGDVAPFTVWIEYADDVDVADIQSVVDNYESLKPAVVTLTVAESAISKLKALGLTEEEIETL
jgi:hypothetical protein